MRLLHRAVVIAALALASAESNAEPTYEEATALGKVDSLNPELRSWYVNEMRPAFRPVFEPLAAQCARRVTEVEVANFGVVFTVTPAGIVKQAFWKNPNRFSECLEQGLRSSHFPPSPKEEFYFGVEVNFNAR